MDAAAELASELQRRVDDSGSGEVRMGTVTVASPLTVDIDAAGSPMPLPRLASYTPTAGDVVLVLTSDRAGWTVLGKVVAP